MAAQTSIQTRGSKVEESFDYNEAALKASKYAVQTPNGLVGLEEEHVQLAHLLETARSGGESDLAVEGHAALVRPQHNWRLSVSRASDADQDSRSFRLPAHQLSDDCSDGCQLDALAQCNGLVQLSHWSTARNR